MNIQKATQRLAFVIVAYCCASCTSEQAVPVLMYHEITDSITPGNQTRVSLERFEEQMKWLADNHYNTLTLDELVAFINGAKAPDNSIVLTFDDGWKSQLLVLSILKHHGFKAAFFVFPGKGIEDPYGDYLSWVELEGISNDPDFEVQAHSMTHPRDKGSNLVTWVAGSPPGKSSSDAEYELKQSKHILEQRLGVPVKYFAWPAGYFNDTLISMAIETGYQALFTILDGTTRQGDEIT
jgi:peptidoglycan/xylan/chitin deacetylase (PgdA/CDA1 family)